MRWSGKAGLTDQKVKGMRVFLSIGGMQLELGLKGSQLRGLKGRTCRETSAEAGTGIQGNDGGVDQWGRGEGAEWPDSGSIMRNPDRLDGEPRCGLRQGKGEGRKAASSLSLPLHCG